MDAGDRGGACLPGRTTLSLPPGHYKLTDQFADGEEHSYGHMMVHGINLTVK